jgi:CDP-glycerol glycerophosphotransferase
MLADDAYRDFEFVWAFRSRIAKALHEQSPARVEALGTVEVEDSSPPSLRWAFGEEALAELSRATIVPYGSREYYRAYARAGCWIANNIIPAHLRPEDDQIFIQTWHGTPLKRLGCDLEPGVKNATFSVREIHDRYRWEGDRFTYLVSPSPFTSEKLSSAFDLVSRGLQDKVIEEGYPRNDGLFRATDETTEAIRRRLRLPADKRCILYAPTFRDDQHAARVGYTYEADVDFDLLRSELSDEFVILFRAHYLVANEFDFARYEGFVYDVSDISDISDLYLVSDVLVTDYSSVFFDYANLGRPMIFYMYDLERYAEGLRGFYLHLSDLPGPVVQTEHELVTELRHAGALSVSAALKLQRFNDRFSPYEDGHAAERVLARTIVPQQRLGLPDDG